MDKSKITLVIEMIDNILHDETMPWDVPFSWAEKKVGISRFRMLLTIICVISMNMIFGIGSNFLSNVVCLMYPAYQTIKIIATQRPLNIFSNIENMKWVMYWLVFTAVLIVEQPLEFILALVPLYQLVRTVFFAWCFLPIKNNGSMFIYNLYFIKGHKYDWRDESRTCNDLAPSSQVIFIVCKIIFSSVTTKPSKRIVAVMSMVK